MEFLLFIVMWLIFGYLGYLISRDDWLRDLDWTTDERAFFGMFAFLGPVFFAASVFFWFAGLKHESGGDILIKRKSRNG